MRFIDRSHCTSMKQKGQDTEIQAMGALTKAAAQKAESLGLGLLKNSRGAYRIIRKSGLGAYDEFFANLAEVDAFLKQI